MFLVNMAVQVAIVLWRPLSYSLKLTYQMYFYRTNTINAIQTYGVWFYETFLLMVFGKIEHQVIRYSLGFFFPEQQYTRGFMFHIVEVFLNLTIMFTLVFVLAMAFYPIITFLSVVIVLFILFQTIVNQGVVNYYYYFSNNKK